MSDHRKAGILWVILGLCVLMTGALLEGVVWAAPADTCTSSNSGNWNTAGTWSCNHVPAAGDNVIIASGHTITVDIDTTSLASLTVNGALVIGNDGTARTVTVSGDVSIASGGSIAPGITAATHSMIIGGNLTNEGTFDGRPTASRVINVTFNKDGNQAISGTGATTRFNLITLSMGTSRSNILQISPSNFDVSSTGFITTTGIQNGTLRISGSFSLSNPVFTGASPTIPANGGFWLDNPNFTVSAQNGSWDLSGLLRVSSGMLNVGTSSGNSVKYRDGSTITIEGGTINIAGRLSRNSSGSTITYTQSGGTVTVVTIESTATSFAGFDIGATGSSFTMSGGTIVVQRSTSAGADYYNVASTSDVTGGTLQIGNDSTSTGQTIRVNSSVPVFNFTINTTNAPTAQLVTNNLTVKGNLNIQSGTTLNANSLNMTVAGNWTNNGTFTAGTGTVTFNGTSEQTISGSTATAFNNLTINSGATVVIPATNTPTVAGTLTNNGTLKQTQTVNNGTVSFLNITNGSGVDKYFGVVISTTNNLGSTTVAVSGNQTCPQTIGYPVKRCYEITPTTAASADIRFYFANSEMQQGQTLSSLNVWHYNTSTSSWDSVTKGGTSSSCDSGAIDCYVEGTSISSYSPFTLKNSNPLGVVLSAFAATVEAEHILVTWETASELNHQGFHLYRAESEAGPWLRLNPTLISSPAPGSPQGQAYRWEDRNVSRNATYYYRLEAVGMDNSTEIIGITAVTYAPSRGHLWLPLVAHNDDHATPGEIHGWSSQGHHRLHPGAQDRRRVTR